jgi:transposase
MVVRTASSKRGASPAAPPKDKPTTRKTDTTSYRRRKARAAAKAAAGRVAEAQKVEAMPVTNRQAAGVDIGGSSHWVCVGFAKDDDPRLVKEFPAHTDGLRAILAYLHEHNVTTVAMEATGIYWVPLFEMLEQNGFEVLLVDPSYTKQLRGRPKTDKRDAQWIYRLHSVGLLAGAFRPDEKTAVLRNYLRQRGNLIRYGGKHIQHMQKALEQMNLKLTTVLSDITGLTGRKIIMAILAGERDPMKLAQLRDPRCQSLPDEIARALDGSYRDEHLFALKQAYEAWQFYQKQLDAVDEKIAEQLTRMKQSKTMPALPPKKRTQKKNANGMRFDVRTALYYVTGVDLTEVEGLDEANALALISEIGCDMSKFPSEKHFCSWLGLCPNWKKTGGKVKSSRTRPGTNRAAQILRLAASNLHSSKGALGAFLRRMKGRIGVPQAVTATAHKLARLVYYSLKYGIQYVRQTQEEYEKKMREKQIANVKRRARQLGLEVIEPKAQAAEKTPAEASQTAKVKPTTEQAASSQKVKPARRVKTSKTATGKKGSRAKAAKKE